MRVNHSKRAAIVLLAAILQLGCGAKNQPYAVHPGAVDETESRMYDSLLIWNGALTQARAEWNAGTLGPNAKDLINRAGEAYNLMRQVRQSYRTAKQAAATADAEAQLAKWNEHKVSVESLISQIIRMTIGRPAPPAPPSDEPLGEFELLAYKEAPCPIFA